MNKKPVEVIRNRLSVATGQLTVGEPVSWGSLGVFPLFRQGESELDYLVYDQAVDQEKIMVTEVDGGGSVPDLRVINQAEQSVLIIYGEQLIGAKQNRIINASVLVAASSKTGIPVSCVEAGRWHLEDAPVMQRSDHPLFMSARAKNAEKVTASLRQDSSYRGDQGQVWDDISDCMFTRNVDSQTAAMEDLYQAERKKLGDYLDRLALEELAPDAGRVTGAIFALGHRVVGMEVFDRPGTLAQLWHKLLLSYAMEAVALKTTPSVTPETAEAWLASVAEAEMQEFPSPGLGSEVRIDGPRIVGGSLACSGEAVHIYAFRRLGSGKNHSHDQSGMASYRHRAHGRGNGHA